MNKRRVALNNGDIEKIKTARTQDLPIYWFLLFSFGLFLIVIIITKEDLSKEGEFTEYIFWSVAILGLLGTIKAILNYEVDLLRGFKIVSNAYCIRYTTTDEGTSHYVRIDNKDFLLIGYNREYFYCFSDKSELYELHFSPLSDVIFAGEKIRE